jgi:pyrroloquinoline-quinone synthase
MNLDAFTPAQRAFYDRLMDVGARKYHDKHPFHVLMNAGKLDREQLKCWAINRFYYQRTIPMKDAAILSNMTDLRHRRRWIQRVVDHDGRAEGEGGIEAWLGLVEAVGGTREEAWDDRNVLPGVRFAVDAYINFCRRAPWQEAVASSLTELFAPALHAVRLSAFPEHYPWIDAEGLRYFKTRIGQARADVEHGLSIVFEHFTTREGQDRVVQLLEFKCDLLWAQMDAIQLACGRAGR